MSAILRQSYLEKIEHYLDGTAKNWQKLHPSSVQRQDEKGRTGQCYLH